MKGQKAAFKSNENGSRIPILGPHGTGSFVKNVSAFVKAYNGNKKDSKALIRIL